jgi:hypothetical protein
MYSGTVSELKVIASDPLSLVTLLSLDLGHDGSGLPVEYRVYDTSNVLLFSSGTLTFGAGPISALHSLSATGGLLLQWGDPSFGSRLALDNITLDVESTAVPEPASLLLLGSGAVALAARYRRTRRGRTTAL